MTPPIVAKRTPVVNHSEVCLFSHRISSQPGRKALWKLDLRVPRRATTMRRLFSWIRRPIASRLVLRRHKAPSRRTPPREKTDHMNANPLEEGKELQLDFAKLAKAAAACPQIIPVAVQNADTKEVILIAYANKQALDRAIDTRTAVFWSTSRGELWEKGKTSGETFELLEIRVNCEQNSLLYIVRPRRGGICHTKNRDAQPRNCYYRRLDFGSKELENLDP